MQRPAGGTQSETTATLREPIAPPKSQVLTNISNNLSSEDDTDEGYEILTTQDLGISQQSHNITTDKRNVVNMSGSLQVKAILQKENGIEDEGSSPEIRRFTVNGTTFDALLARVRTVFNTEELDHNLFWKDEDDDLVQFSTTEELRHAMDHMGDGTLRIYITVSSHHAREESMATDSLYPNLEDEESTPLCKETTVPGKQGESSQGAKPTRRVTFETPLSGFRPPNFPSHPHAHFHTFPWKAGRCRPFMGPGMHWPRKGKMLKKMMCMRKMMARAANTNNEEFNTVRQQVPEEFRSWVRQYVRTWFLQGAETANETDTLPTTAPRHFKKWLNDFLCHWTRKNAAFRSEGVMGMEEDGVEQGVEAQEDGPGEMLAAPEGLPPLYYQWLCLFLPRFYQNQVKSQAWAMDGNEGKGPHCPPGPWHFHGHGMGHHNSWGWHHGKHGCHGGKKAWKKRGRNNSSSSESEDSDGDEKMWKNIPKEFRKYVRVSIKKLHKNKGDNPKAKEKAIRAGVTPEVVEFVQQILLEWHAKLSQKRPRVVATEMMEAERTLPSGLAREHFLWMCRFMARWHRRHAGKCDIMSGWSSGETDDDTTSGEEGCAPRSHGDRRHFKAMKRCMRLWHHHPHGMMGPMGHPAPPPFAMHPGMDHCYPPPPPPPFGYAHPPPPFGCAPPPPFSDFAAADRMMSGPGFRMTCGPGYNAHGCGGPHQKAWEGDSSASGCQRGDGQAGQTESSNDDMVDHVIESMKKI